MPNKNIMFLSLLSFEFYYQAKQKALPLFALLFLGFGYILGSQGQSPANLNFNSPYQLAHHTALLTLGCVFPIMFFVISGMLRDRQYNFESLIYSTAVAKPLFFWARFLGAFLFSLIAFSPILIGFQLGFLQPSLDPERITSFHGFHYFWIWLVLILPNIFICSAIIYAVAAITKNRIATYTSAILIYAFYWMCALFLNSPLLANAVPASPENLVLAALADPFGISAFFEQTQYWTTFDRNHKLLTLSGNFLWNRIIWICIALSVILITYRLFSFRQIQSKKKAQKSNEKNVIDKKAYKTISISNNTKSQQLSFWSLLKLETTAVIKSLPFFAVIGIWIVIVFTEIYSRINGGGEYSVNLLPTTNLLIWLIKDPLPFLGVILIIFYSGEIIWRERDLGFVGIIDTTPTYNATFFFAKLTTLILLPIFLIISSILIAIGFQISEGYYQFELGQYFNLFYYSGARLIFYCLFASFIQILSRQKYLGMILTALIMLLLGSSIANQFGIYHPLFQLGRLPEVEYNNMNGYGDYSFSFHSLFIYWMSFALLLGLSSFLLWRRGSIQNLAFRISQLKFNWLKQYSLVFGMFITIFICSGAYIFHNTNIQTEFTTPNQVLNDREAYERKFKHFHTPYSLFPVDIKTQVDLFPSEGIYHIKADYWVENKSDTAITQIFVSERAPVTTFTLDQAILVEQDTYFNTRLYQLHKPLDPGQKIHYQYELRQEKKGFDINLGLVENGSYLMRNEFDPVLNYRLSQEISDPYEREKRGLPKRVEEHVDESHLHEHVPVVSKSNFETIVSTDLDQTAIAPGDLVRKWTDQNRHFFHYRSPKPIIPIINYFSARYKLREEKHNDINLELYYHPGHEYNIDNMAKFSHLTLDYCEKNFCSYDLNHLRIAEIPGHWFFGGQAMIGTISMVEDRLYLIDNRDTTVFDLVAKRTIHEIAHQWWGGMFSPKNIEGASLIIEGLAKYTEAAVMEKEHGWGAVWQLSHSANQRYFKMRPYSREPEPPLYLSAGENYLSYGKSFISILAAKELLGEEQMNHALRQLLQKHKNEIEPTATSLDFLHELYQVASVEDSILLNDWFKRRITYDLSLSNVNIQEGENGQFEVTFDLSAQRFENNDSGEPKSIGINESIPIGLFSKPPKDLKKNDQAIHFQNYPIKKKNNTITIMVDQKPTFLSIDPLGTRLEENRVNNLWKF